MTITDQISASETGDLIDEISELATSPKPQRRLRVLIALSLVVVLIAGVGTYALMRYNASAALSAAQDHWTSARASLTASVEAGQTALASSEGHVGDESVRTTLEQAIAAGTALTASSPQEVDQLDEAVTAADSARTTITVATAAVTDAVTAWDFEQATAAAATASTDLQAEIDAAALVLTDSEGRVADNAVRQSLTDTITAATAATTSTGSTVDELGAFVDGAETHVAALAAASTAVTDAVAVWQAEQDRLAAEQAAAAAAQAAANRPSLPAGTNKTKTPSQTTTAPPRTSPELSKPAPSTPPADDGSYWESETTTDGSKLCAGADGSVWRC